LRPWDRSTSPRRSRVRSRDTLEVDLAEEPGERDPRVTRDRDGRMSSHAVPAVVTSDDLLGLERVTERPACPLEELEVATFELVALDRLASQPARGHREVLRRPREGVHGPTRRRPVERRTLALLARMPGSSTSYVCNRER
jgi:hypothetical protein